MQDSKTMVAVVRDIGTIEREIQVLKDQSARIVLSYAIEVGRRLCEAKEMLPHGEWGSWLKQRAGFSQSTANNMMRLFEEYGADQLTLFGAIPNSQALGNLSYTKAISLLALPAEERDEVLKTNDVEAMSTRELERLIREKKEADAKASEAEAKANAAQEALEAEKKRAQAALDERDVAEAREEKAVKRAEEYESVAKDANNKLFALKERLKEAERRLQAADGQAAELAREKARAAAQAEIELLKGRIKEAQDAAEAAKQEAQVQIGKLQARVEQAAALTKDSKEEAERLRRELEQLKARDRQDSRVPEFKAIFVRVQGEVSALKKLIGDIRADDPETAGKLETAMKKFAEVMAK